MRRKAGTHTVVLWHEPGWIHQRCLERERRRETNSFVVLFYRPLNDPKPIRADGVSDDTHLPLTYICLIFSVSVSHCVHSPVLHVLILPIRVTRSPDQVLPPV